MSRSMGWIRFLVTRARTRSRGAAVALLLVAPCAGCVTGGVYSGNGWLAISGSVPMLASEVAVFRQCLSGARPMIGDYTPSFAVLALGTGCVIVGRLEGSTFYPDPGTACPLQFAEGARMLRVSDVSVQYGISAGAFYGQAYVDPSVVHFEIGGTDATTGAHAVYQFSGTSVDQPSASPSCDDERAKLVGHQNDVPLGGP